MYIYEWNMIDILTQSGIQWKEVSVIESEQ